MAWWDGLIPGRKRELHLTEWHRKLKSINALEQHQLTELAELIGEAEAFYKQSELSKTPELMHKDEQAYNEFTLRLEEQKARLLRNARSEGVRLRKEINELLRERFRGDEAAEATMLEECEKRLSLLESLEKEYNMGKSYRIGQYREEFNKRKEYLERHNQGAGHRQEQHDLNMLVVQTVNEMKAHLAFIDEYEQKYLNLGGRNLQWYEESMHHPQIMDMMAANRGLKKMHLWAAVSLFDDITEQHKTDIGNPIILECLRHVPPKGYREQIIEGINEAAKIAVKNGLLNAEEEKEINDIPPYQKNAREFSFEKRLRALEGSYEDRLIALNINMKDEMRKTLKDNIMTFCRTFEYCHKIVRDIDYRHALKKRKEKEYLALFASHMTQLKTAKRLQDGTISAKETGEVMYPFKEILEDGKISSMKSLKDRGERYTLGSVGAIGGAVADLPEISLSAGMEVMFGSAGFLFPLTELLADHYFFEMQSLQGGTGTAHFFHYNEFHIFQKDNVLEGAEIDINRGFLVVPKNAKIRYGIGKEKKQEMTVKEHIREILSRLKRYEFRCPACGKLSHTSGRCDCGREYESCWFYDKDQDDWMEKHCLFYDEHEASQILNRVKQDTRMLAKMLESFSNGLAIIPPIKGEIVPTNIPSVTKIAIGGGLGIYDKDIREIENEGSTLFEWDTKGAQPSPPVVRKARKDIRDRIWESGELVIEEEDLQQIEFVTSRENDGLGSYILYDYKDQIYEIHSVGQYQTRASVIAYQLMRLLGFRTVAIAYVVKKFGGPIFNLATGPRGDLEKKSVMNTDELKKMFLAGLWINNWEWINGYHVLQDDKGMVLHSFEGSLYHELTGNTFKNGKEIGVSIVNIIDYREAEIDWISQEISQSLERDINATIAQFGKKFDNKQVLALVLLGENVNTADPVLREMAEAIVSIPPSLIKKAVWSAGFWTKECEKTVIDILIARQKSIRKLFNVKPHYRRYTDATWRRKKKQ
ncbi:MAG: hypothetical protein ABIH34_05135 [Nanoarchaeota archaeon]